MTSKTRRFVAVALVGITFTTDIPEADAAQKAGQKPHNPPPQHQAQAQQHSQSQVHAQAQKHSQAQMHAQAQAMQRQAIQQHQVLQRQVQAKRKASTANSTPNTHGNINPQGDAQRQAVMRQRAYRQGANQNRSLAYANRAYPNRYGVRRYRGNSYANRYASSNRNIRIIVSRLRSTHHALTGLDHDYQGHRVRAMHAISSAIHALSHRSSNGMNGFNNSIAMQTRQNRGLGTNRNLAANRNISGNNGNNRLRMPQAQSDSRMRHAMQNLLLVSNQLSSQGSTHSHQRALASIQVAYHELGTALQIR